MGVGVGGREEEEDAEGKTKERREGRGEKGGEGGGVGRGRGGKGWEGGERGGSCITSVVPLHDITCDSMTVLVAVRDTDERESTLALPEPHLLHSHAREIHHPNSTVAIGMILDMWVRKRRCGQWAGLTP